MKLPNNLAIRGRNAKMQRTIISAIMDALTVQEAIAAVHALEQSSERLHEFINRPHIKGDVVDLLVAKFAGSRDQMAKRLDDEII